MLRVVVFTLTLLCSYAIALNELSEGDASGEVSVHLVDGGLWVVEGLRNLSETVVAHATFVNSQGRDSIEHLLA